MLRIAPHDRTLQVRVARTEIDLAMLDLVKPIGVGKEIDFCDYVGVCHYTCFRKDAQNCSTYNRLYGRIGIQGTLFPITEDMCKNEV